MTPTQLGALKPAVASELSIEQLDKLTTTQVKGLPKSLVANLDTAQKAAIAP